MERAKAKCANAPGARGGTRALPRLFSLPRNVFPREVDCDQLKDFTTFHDINGDSYRMITSLELDGPRARRQKLLKHRQDKRDQRAKAVGVIQTMMPSGYQPPTEIHQLGREFNARDIENYPRCAVFVKSVPQIPEYELYKFVLN